MNWAILTLIILLAIVFVIFLLLLFPFKIIVSFNKNGWRIFLKYLFIKINLVPSKKKKGKAEKKPKTTTPKKQSEKKKSESFLDTVSSFLSALSSGGRVLRLLLSMHKTKIYLTAKVSKEDAAQTAIECGKLSAYFHSALALLANTTEIKKRQINVFPDYDGKKTEYRLFALFWVLPIRLLVHSRELIPELLSISDVISNKNSKKGE